MASLKHTISGIYVIYNRESGKFYVGSAQNIQKRWREHRCSLHTQTHRCIYLQRAWNKEGEQVFEFLILEQCTIDKLLEIEQFYLDLWWKKGVLYNIASTAGASMRGRTHTEQTRRLLSEQRRGKRLSKETCQRLSKALKGRIVSEETRYKISQSHIGKKQKPCSDETRKKLSLAGMGRKMGPMPEVQKQKISETKRGKPGVPLTEEAKLKISIAHKGRIHTKEARLHMSQAHVGIKMPPRSKEHCQKIVEFRTGTKHSEETKRKISEVKKARNAERRQRRELVDGDKA